MNPIIAGPISTADMANAGERAQNAGERAQIDRDRRESLLPQDFVQELRGRWDRAQTGFVDEPRGAVQAADELVAATMKRLAESFADERARLEQMWDRGEKVDTEDLRQALRKYRTFFERLLSI
jgi:hypothetical protein